MKNNTIKISLLLLPFLILISCVKDKLEKKGFSVASIEASENSNDGIQQDSLRMETCPSNVLLTGMPDYRLATIYKVNYNKSQTRFIGSNNYHTNYSPISQKNGNQWNDNYLPGFEALSGYNLVNISHFNNKTQKQKIFFEKPVLIRTLYYPSFSQDTLNYQPVHRNYFMISVYDEDTNKDGRIDMNDLRRFYYFDKDAANKRGLIPTDHSVHKSEYDPANDYFFIFAHLDENGNGRYDETEKLHIFWIDLKNPERVGKLY